MSVYSEEHVASNQDTSFSGPRFDTVNDLRDILQVFFTTLLSRGSFNK